MIGPNEKTDSDKSDDKPEPNDHGSPMYRDDDKETAEQYERDVLNDGK